MSLNRFATRTDGCQKPIIEALTKAGWEVWVIKWPVDLLCYKNGKLRALECKGQVTKKGKAVLDKRRVAQARFCQITDTKYATTPEEALKALGE